MMARIRFPSPHLDETKKLTDSTVTAMMADPGMLRRTAWYVEYPNPLMMSPVKFDCRLLLTIVHEWLAISYAS